MSQQSIRRSIEATEKIRKITKAMQLVSVNHLTRASALERNGKPYVTALKDIMNQWMFKHEEHAHPYFQKKAVSSQLIIVYGCDRGLCGALNLNVLKLTMEEILSSKEKNIHSHVMAIGDKPSQFLARRGIQLEASVTKLGMHPHIDQLSSMIKAMLDGYMSGKWQRVLLIYPKFVNTMVQTPIIESMLPLESPGLERPETLSDQIDYIYEPSVSGVINRLLENYIDSKVYQATLETLASEQAARMVAMQNATDNAETCKDELERSYHKMRQAGITREIAEITSGAEAI